MKQFIFVFHRYQMQTHLQEQHHPFNNHRLLHSDMTKLFHISHRTGNTQNISFASTCMNSGHKFKQSHGWTVLYRRHPTRSYAYYTISSKSQCLFDMVRGFVSLRRVLKTLKLSKHLYGERNL